MKKIIIISIIGLLMCAGCGVVPNNKCMGSYNKEMANKEIEFKDEYAICSNVNDDPIFKDNEKAFNKIKKDYSKTLEIIKETFSLEDFSKNNVDEYYKYSSQLIATSEDNKKDGANLSTLLEIYKNANETSK